ncbi:MAG: RDD family protein [Pseudonocardia sp.]|nr:RDD family protein [Pseudonocardia sp.]
MPTIAQTARWRPRLGASLVDLAAIVVWLGLLTALGFVVRPLLPAAGAPPLPATDQIAFAATVLPTWIYLTVGEAGRHQAGPGKRAAGLRVVGAGGFRPSVGRIAVRNMVKLVPWQLSHVAVARLILGIDDPITIGTAYGLAVLIVAVTVVMAVRDPAGRALHDRLAATRVVAAR